MEYRLNLEDITKTFPGVVAVNKANVKIKKGEVHALVGENGLKQTQVQTFPVHAVDTTGAGDLFAAGALYGLLKEFSLVESAILGSYCASQVVSHMGGRLPIDAYTDATKILSEYKKLYSDGGGL